MGLFVISDTHWCHWNINKYCNRGFSNVEEMNVFMVERWNSVISQDDTVYHLGDFGFGHFLKIKEFYDKLNGTKILIMGNHDMKRSIGWWYRIGFSIVYRKPVVYKNVCILSHYPIKSNDIINIHGHIHNSPYGRDFEYKKHINVSVEVVDYYPVNLEELLRHHLGKKV